MGCVQPPFTCRPHTEVVWGVSASHLSLADIVRRVMAGDPNSEIPPPPQGVDAGWTAVGYLLGGMIVWGGAGWLADRWLDLPYHVGLLIGLIGGGAAGVYLIVKRLGA